MAYFRLLTSRGDADRARHVYPAAHGDAASPRLGSYVDQAERTAVEILVNLEEGAREQTQGAENCAKQSS